MYTKARNLRGYFKKPASHNGKFPIGMRMWFKCWKTKILQCSPVRKKTNTDKGKLKASEGNSLVFQWLGLLSFIAKGLGLISGQGINISQDEWHIQKKKVLKLKL